MTSTYDLGLVTLSIIIAILASYAALSFAGRVTTASGSARLGWLAGGAVVMGLGIWSMHFVGMLAFRLPVPIGYGLNLILVSVAVAIAASLLALIVMSGVELRPLRLFSASILMGAGISGMHYIGMAAMSAATSVTYSVALVALSILIAIVASWAALWLVYHFRSGRSRGALLKSLSAVVMGGAIAGMHYTAMTAARFSPGSMMTAPGGGSRVLATRELGEAITLGALVIIVLGIVGSAAERRWLTERAALSDRLAMQAALLSEQKEELTVQAEQLAEQAVEQEELNATLQSTNQMLQERTDALEESERRFRFLAEAIPVHVWTASPDGTLDFATEHTARYFGLSPAELLERGWAGVVHPTDVAAVRQGWAQSLASGVPFDAEVRLLRDSDGEYRWHITRARPLRGDHGEVIRWFGSNTDIEELKRVERARDQALLEAERAREAEHEANQARMKFVSMASHELRTPLGAIGGFAELLLLGLRGPINEAQRNDLQRIQTNQKHLLRLINEMLELAKLEAGQMPVRLDEVQLSDVLDAASPMVEPQLIEKNITYKRELEPGTPKVIGDAERVQQIVINLVANSIKFTPHSGTITVSTRNTGGEVELRVRDTGPGIPADKVDSLFSPFVQLGSPAEKAGGTGLGLAISRELARAMGGELAAIGGVGDGATFVLALRAAGRC
jgi:PAS domain S-box-containing protein